MSTTTTEQLNASFVSSATICAVMPIEEGEQDHRICQRTYGPVRIDLPHPGEAYKLSSVTWKTDRADVGDYNPDKIKRTGIDPRKQFVFDARQIADDVCKEINGNGPGGDSFFGVFVCQGNEPTKAELESAKRRLENYFMQCVAAADSQWSSSPRHDLISGVAKRGARYLKLNPEDHEWMSNFQTMTDCPACGTRIKPNVAICKACGAVLDEKKAQTFHLLDKEPKAKTI